MRIRAETLLIAVMSSFALAGMAGVHFLTEPPEPARNGAAPLPGEPLPSDPRGASDWFADTRRLCNPVEVDTGLREHPAPLTSEGIMYAAACYALAGRVDRARDTIERLPPSDHVIAAAVLFGVGHPAADAGDEAGAAPLMQLVVEYSPEHVMALYHAAAGTFERGDHQAARGYLIRFLDAYTVQDDWRARAVSMLETIETG